MMFISSLSTPQVVSAQVRRTPRSASANTPPRTHTRPSSDRVRGLLGWFAAGLLALGTLLAPALAQAEELPTLPLTVNVNTADARTIANVLQGVGLSRAAAIVAYREQHGVFKSVESLSAVKGVGPRTVALNATRTLVAD